MRCFVVLGGIVVGFVDGDGGVCDVGLDCFLVNDGLDGFVDVLIILIILIISMVQYRERSLHGGRVRRQRWVQRFGCGWCLAQHARL